MAYYQKTIFFCPILIYSFRSITLDLEDFIKLQEHTRKNQESLPNNPNQFHQDKQMWPPLSFSTHWTDPNLKTFGFHSVWPRGNTREF